MLQMTCTIEKTQDTINVSVQWFYTDSSENAGRDGSDLSEELTNDLTVIGATLTLPNDQIRVGYYWCMSKGITRPVQLNPSVVVYISNPCFSDVCESSLVIATKQSMRCAHGDAAEDLSIVNLQDTASCTEGTTTESDGDNGDESSTTPDDKIEPSSNPTTTTSTTTTTTAAAAAGTTTDAEDSATDGSIAGLAPQLTWVLVGVGTVVLLVIIAVLLTVITFMQCNRRRVKGERLQQDVVSKYDR